MALKPEPNQLTVEDLRARVARVNVPLYQLAAAANLHPTTLGRILNERLPMPAGFPARVERALDVVRERAKALV